MREFLNIDVKTPIENLKQRVASGDEHAFRELFNLFAERLTVFAYSITRNRDAAVEIFDEVFVKIWKNREMLPQIDNLTTYLYTATKNTALNYISTKSKENCSKEFDFINIALGEDERPDQQMISAEIFGKIKKAVEELPPKCKIIFKLVREDGLKYKEVAEVLNISEKTVDAQMVIAVKRISQNVKGYFDTFPARFQKNIKNF
ncbi:MAG: RNA polymerase sigma-70 factor [Niabella sp.]